ncbi:CHASE2 domain-containing protein [Candidatus Pelagibacter communis]|uniref:CHASE2 domain-containing protein n=1 Tax=Pelagibacter ubique TaxID=198252 RepID=UPI0009E213EC|nr:CHASE2 domain-containing protein [Candidatus Pelagibacter ubique]
MKAFLQKNTNYFIFFAILLLLISLKIINPPFIKSVSYLSFDLYQKVFAKKKDSDVVIIDIDEKSLGKFGQFPWNRTVFAKILDQLNTSDPKAIGFDIFFTEKDKQSPEEIIKSYGLIPSDVAELQNLKSPDDLFAEKLKESKSIIAVLGSNVPSHTNYDRKAKARFLSKGGDPFEFTYSYPFSIGSLEVLENNVKGLGSISFLDQLDGIIRSLPLIVQLNKKLYPTIGLEMVRVGEKQKNIYVELNEVGINRISARPHKIDSDPNGIIWIKYKKSQKKQYISASDVYEGNFDKSFFQNKYVLIGASAQGLFDLVKTPLGITIPGVEVHANVIENILDKSYLVRNPNTYIFELLFSIIVALITFILSQKIKPRYSLSIFFGNILAIIIIGFSVYKFKSQLVDISYPLFIVTVTFLTGLYFRFIEENKLALENLQKEAKLLKERELAAGVQKSLFPDISKFENFIFARNVPARDVSGDYFDVVRSTPEEYFFTLADVSGKGIKAGMYMAKASSIFRTLTNLKYPIEKVVFGVNNELVEAKFKGMFVTAVFGKLNIKTGEMVFINAGHESILTFDQNKNYEYIKSEMPPIGIVKYFSESMVKSNTINMKDKTFVVYTDGVTEGYLQNGEELGSEGVQNIINNISDVTPKAIVESIEKKLNWGAEKLRDDITCMAINIKNTELIKKKPVEKPKKVESK